MSEPYYPDLTTATLYPFKIIKDALAEDPSYLDRPDCPYPPDVRDFLRFLAVSNGQSGKKPGVFDQEGDLWTIVENEIKDLYNDLHGLTGMGTSLSTSEKISIFKTRHQLLDKLVALGERVMNLKQFSEFQQTILNFIDLNFSATQRAELMSQLRHQVGTPATEQASSEDDQE